MSETWLVSYAVFWSLIGVNTLLALAIARFVMLVRSRWYADAQSLELPFVGSRRPSEENNQTETLDIPTGTMPPAPEAVPRASGNGAATARRTAAEISEEIALWQSAAPGPRSGRLDAVSVIIPIGSQSVVKSKKWCNFPR